MSMLQRQQLTLICHKLCPYVQRAVTVLEEKGLAYQRIDIDLNNKPAWFTQLSPLGKVPLLVIDDDAVLFESAVIGEYINDISGGELLSSSMLGRARDRSWIEFASSTLNNIGEMYNAVDEKSFMVTVKEFNAKFSHLEKNLTGSLADAVYFNGTFFSLVDAAFAPVFRYLNVFEQWGTFIFLAHYPKITAWRNKLFERTAIQQSVSEDYPILLTEFVARRPSHLGVLAKNFLENPATTI